jgi:hypothetical protein
MTSKVRITSLERSRERVFRQADGQLRSEKLVAEARGQFANPEEGERPPLGDATKQRLMKTEKTLCVL